MRIIIKIILLSLVILSCQKETDKYLVEHTDWENRKSDIINFNDYVQGKTYLPVYSHIYHIILILTNTKILNKVSIQRRKRK